MLNRVSSFLSLLERWDIFQQFSHAIKKEEETKKKEARTGLKLITTRLYMGHLKYFPLFLSLQVSLGETLSCSNFMSIAYRDHGFLQVGGGIPGHY